MGQVNVLSLGGSIIAPNGVDSAFLGSFFSAIAEYLRQNRSRKIILVTGGGAPARAYQDAYRHLAKEPDADALDWIGIAATRLNGTLVRAIFSEFCHDELVTDPTGPISFSGQVLVAAGWKPGFSTDTDAVYLAERFHATMLVNLSNIAKVYTADPKTDPHATPVDTISWEDFRLLVGDSWTPGKNVPFDPIAAKKAQEINLKVICADGKNIANTMAILSGNTFYGTVIG